MRLAIVTTCALLAGCSRTAEPRGESLGPAIDAPVVAYLSMARARHHEANIHENNGDANRAAEALRTLISAPRPHAGQRVPEVEEVVADTCARLAELDLARGERENAARDVEEGLAHAPPNSYFRGHLLEVSGIVEEVNGNALADAGNVDGAKLARERAVARLREAVDIQEKIVQQRTSEAGP